MRRYNTYTYARSLSGIHNVNPAPPRTITADIASFCDVDRSCDLYSISIDCSNNQILYIQGQKDGQNHILWDSSQCKGTLYFTGYSSPEAPDTTIQPFSDGQPIDLYYTGATTKTFGSITGTGHQANMTQVNYVSPISLGSLSYPIFYVRARKTSTALVCGFESRSNLHKSVLHLYNITSSDSCSLKYVEN